MNTDFLSEYLILASDGSELSSSDSSAEETTTATAKKDIDVTPTETIILGIGTVFAGLIAIIIICKVMGYFCNLGKNTADESSEPKTQASAVQASVPEAKSIDSTVDRGELAAAISAAIAEELGTDVAGIKILSIKKV